MRLACNETFKDLRVSKAPVSGYRVSVVLEHQRIGRLANAWQLLGQMRVLTREHGVPLIVDDRLDVALAVEADGSEAPAGARVRARV